MMITYKKQPTKYLDKTDTNTRAKLEKAIDGLQELNGDIVRIKGTDLFRLKIDHYRIGFAYNNDTETITIEAILPRGEFYKNITKRR